MKYLFIIFTFCFIFFAHSSFISSKEIDNNLLIDKYISIYIALHFNQQNIPQNKRFNIDETIATAKIALKRINDSDVSNDNNLLEDYMKFINLLVNHVDLAKNIETTELTLKGIKAGFILTSASKNKKVKELWAGLFVPQYAHGNDGVFFALQTIRENYDDQVIAWALENYKLHSPFILMEASRRLSSKDIDKAVFWYLVGLWKIRDEVKKCNKLTAGDVPTYWRDYGLKFLVPNVNKLKLKSNHVIFRNNLINILKDWEQLIPPDNQSWFRCKTVKSNRENWLAINHSLKIIAEKQCNEFH